MLFERNRVAKMFKLWALVPRYTGAAGDTRALTCGLCGGGLCAAVALQPCGHSFCATCLSHHLAAAMVAGGRLRCPER